MIAIISAVMIPPTSPRVVVVTGSAGGIGTSLVEVFEDIGIADIVSYISRFITLEPGDVTATGTPDGVGFARTPPRYMVNGDVMTVWIGGIGELTNPCVVE